MANAEKVVRLKNKKTGEIVEKLASKAKHIVKFGKFHYVPKKVQKRKTKETKRFAKMARLLADPRTKVQTGEPMFDGTIYLGVNRGVLNQLMRKTSR